MVEDPASYPKPSQALTEQLICYYYHSKNTDFQSSISQYCQQTKEDLMGIWQSVNPRLFLISTSSIEKKRFAVVGKRYQSKTQ